MAPAKEVSQVTMRTGAASKPTTIRRRCPFWPNVPIAVYAVLILVVAVAIAVSVTLFLGGHPTNLASGVIWE